MDIIIECPENYDLLLTVCPSFINISPGKQPLLLYQWYENIDMKGKWHKD